MSNVIVFPKIRIIDATKRVLSENRAPVSDDEVARALGLDVRSVVILRSWPNLPGHVRDALCLLACPARRPERREICAAKILDELGGSLQW
jgi:hypothetical protein